MQNIFPQNVLFSLCAIAFLATPLSAQQTANTETSGSEARDNEIVVTGIKELEAAVATYVKATLARPPGGQTVGQYARFSSPVCAATYGLSAANNAQVAERIQRIARAADVPTAGSQCDPNLFVVVIKDGERAITQLRKKHHRIFGELPIYKRKQLAESPGPVFGWKTVFSTSAEGGRRRSAGSGSSFAGTGQAGGDGLSLSDDAFSASRSNVKSLIKKPVKRSTTGAFVLLEEKALVGMTTVQIADFAAMYTLMEVQGSIDTQAAPDSILTLFHPALAPDDRPASVSEWDLVILSALYNTPSDVSASMQRAMMLRRITKELSSGRPAGG